MKTLTKYGLVLLLGILLINVSCSKDDGPEAPTPVAEETPKEEEPANNPPSSFNLIEVADGDVAVDVYPTFSWQEAIDPDGDAITYDLYLGKEEDPTELYAADLSDTFFEVTERLHTYDTYYWKVVAKDPENGTVSSTVNEFSVRGLHISDTPINENVSCLPRQSHTMEVYQNKIWLFGGFHGGQKNDVWSSSDGTSWVEVPQENPFSARSGHSSAVFANKLWIIGGWSEGEAKNDVLFSEDGINWISAIENAPFSWRFGHTTVAFKNKLWVIAGTADDDFAAHDNDVWFSEDGFNWTAATENAPFSGRYGHTTVVFDEKLWVIGGRDNEGNKNDIWFSEDGINWIKATSSAPFSKGTKYASSVFDDKIWFIDDNVWFSTDGTNWIEATAASPFSEIRGHSTAIFNDRIWVIGGYQGGSAHSNIWAFD